MKEIRVLIVYRVRAVHAVDREVDSGERERGGARGRGVPLPGAGRGAARPQQLQRRAGRRGRLRLRLRAPPARHLPGAASTLSIFL